MTVRFDQALRSSLDLEHPVGPSRLDQLVHRVQQVLAGGADRLHVVSEPIRMDGGEYVVRCDCGAWWEVLMPKDGPFVCPIADGYADLLASSLRALAVWNRVTVRSKAETARMRILAGVPVEAELSRSAPVSPREAVLHRG